MKQTKALRAMLEDMTEVYMDRLGAEVPAYNRDVPDVEFTTDTPHAAQDGSYVAVAPNVRDTYGKDMEGANELRVIVDTLNHEVAHIKYSDLTGKREFSEEYPDAPQMAGMVLNVLEDQYIDWQRLARFRGLRRAHSFKVDKIMANGHRRPPISNLDASEAVAEGFLQYAFSGYVKGYSDAPDTVKTAIARCRPLVDEVRNAHDEGRREEIAHECMDILLEAVPEPDEADDYVDEADEQMPTDDVPEVDAEDVEQTSGPSDGPEVEAEDEGEAEDSEAGDGDADPQGDDEDEAEQGNGGAGTAGEDAEDGDDGGDSVEDDIDELEDREREREAGEHWNAGDSDYEQADEGMKNRHETIKRETAKNQTDIGEQKRRRQEKIEDGRDGIGVRDSPEQIREKLREDGLAQDIVDAFKEFKTNDRWISAREGERLDTRNAVRRVAGDYTEDKVYQQKQKAEVGDRAVGVAMDLSGSMSDYNGNLVDAKMALGALHLATKTIGDSLLATGYKTLDGHPQKSDTEPVVDLITGPQEDFKWEHLDGARAGMYTPTPDGIMYTLDLLQQTHEQEKVMLVITDGDANIPLGGTERYTSKDEGRADTKKAVNTAKQRGVKVIGLAVGHGVTESYMNDTFGSDWVAADMDDLADKLVEIYRGQMRVDPSGR